MKGLKKALIDSLMKGAMKKLAASEPSGNSRQLVKSGTKTPSKHIPLARLKQIKQDNNVGENGTDYSEQELHDAILDRKVSQANKMVSSAKNKENKAAQDAQNSKVPSFPPPMPKKRTFGKSITFNIQDEDLLEKSAPVQENEQHPNQPWVSRYHPNGMLMWHANQSQANKIDSTIQNPELVQRFLDRIPEHHKENVKKIINHTLSDPNRHFIPSEDNGKQKLRARHIRDLLLGGNGVSVNTEDPNNLKITRESHSQAANYKPIVFNFRNGANNGSPKTNDRSGTSGSVQDLHVRNGSPSGLQPRGSGLRPEQGGGPSSSQPNSPARRIGDTKQIEPVPAEKVSSRVMVRRSAIKKSLSLDQYLNLKSLIKSENDVILNSMEKSMASKIALAGMIGASSLLPSKTTQNNIPSQPKVEQKQGLDKQRALRAIAMVESRNGKATNHKPTSQGTAYGTYGLMVNTIKDTIAKNPNFKAHSAALNMDQQDLHNYMSQNPKLEHQIASAYYDKLHNKFGDDLAAVSHGWLSGVTGTIKAKQQGKDIKNHWHVLKVAREYGKP